MPAEGESGLTRLHAAFGMIRDLTSPRVETPRSPGARLGYFDEIEEGRSA
jgi:hypothetical protein